MIKVPRRLLRLAPNVGDANIDQDLADFRPAMRWGARDREW
jgi:hypothetical protein